MQQISKEIHPSVDWTAYAKAYDLFLTHNPPYQQLLKLAEKAFRRWSVAPGGVLLDLGAGTGNFSIPLAKAHPQATVLHVEPDLGMISRAEAKARAENLSNIHFVRSTAEKLSIEGGALAGAICMHALYTMPSPQVRMNELTSWLAPGARAVLCDLGRVMNVADWSLYFAKHWLMSYGFTETIRIFKNNKPLAKANNHIREEQLAGRYWVHDHDEFVGAVQRCGLQVQMHRKAYRNYSDFVLCSKPT